MQEGLRETTKDLSENEKRERWCFPPSKFWLMKTSSQTLMTKTWQIFVNFELNEVLRCHQTSPTKFFNFNLWLHERPLLKTERYLSKGETEIAQRLRSGFSHGCPRFEPDEKYHQAEIIWKPLSVTSCPTFCDLYHNSKIRQRYQAQVIKSEGLTIKPSKR